MITDRKGKAVFKAHGYNNDTVVFAGKSTDGSPLLDGIYYYTVVLYNNGFKMNRVMWPILS